MSDSYCRFTHKVLDGEIRISDLSLNEMREVCSDIKTRIKDIDKKADEKGVSYKELERLADRRYKLSKTLGNVEDAIIRKHRNSANFSSIAYNGGGIYTDANTKGFSQRCGRSAKFSLRGISI